MATPKIPLLVSESNLPTFRAERRRFLRLTRAGQSSHRSRVREGGLLLVWYPPPGLVPSSWSGTGTCPHVVKPRTCDV